MQQAKFITRILITIAATLLIALASCAFAGEKVLFMGQLHGFRGFERDNVYGVNDVVLWQTDSVKAVIQPKTVNFKVIKTDSGKDYIEAEGLGRAEVRPLQLVIDGTRAQDTVAIKAGGSVPVSSGGSWKFLDTVRGKKIRKGDKLTIARDDFDTVFRMFPWEDTWQCAVQKE